MSDLRLEYEKLLTRYKEKEKKLIELQGHKKSALVSLNKIEEKLKKILKNTPLEELDNVLEKLDKEVNTRLSILSEKLSEYESLLSDLKVEEGSDEEPTSMDNILEEI